jgi:hypothetical protein
MVAYFPAPFIRRAKRRSTARGTAELTADG